MRNQLEGLKVKFNVYVRCCMHFFFTSHDKAQISAVIGLKIIFQKKFFKELLKLGIRLMEQTVLLSHHTSTG